MTNRELLRAPPDTLAPLDRQRRHVLAVKSTPVPCPACRTPVDAITAAGLDVDQTRSGRMPRRTAARTAGRSWTGSPR